MAKTNYVIVRFYNRTKLDILNEVFTGVEYEQVGEDVDVWFEGKRLAKQAVKEYTAGKCEIIDVDFVYIGK